MRLGYSSSYSRVPRGPVAMLEWWVWLITIGASVGLVVVLASLGYIYRHRIFGTTLHTTTVVSDSLPARVRLALTVHKPLVDSPVGVTVSKKEGDRLILGNVVPESIAAKAGLLPGDAVLSVNGCPVSSPVETTTLMKSARHLQVVVERVPNSKLGVSSHARVREYLQHALDHSCKHGLPLHVGMADVARELLEQRHRLAASSDADSDADHQLLAELSQHQTQTSDMASDVSAEQHEEFVHAIEALDQLGTTWGTTEPTPTTGREVTRAMR